MRSGRCSEQDTLERPICVNGFGLLPTATASTYGYNKGGSAGRTGKTRPSLQTMAAQGFLPTHVASNHYVTGGEPTLMGMAKRFGFAPTATVKGNYNKAGLSQKSGDGLQTWLDRVRGQRGPLAPSFLEWYMGFPINWTLPIVSTDDTEKKP